MSFTLKSIRKKRKRILELARKHGAYNLRIFGSVARDEADEDSDIDFIADFEQGRSLFDMAGLLADLKDLLGNNVDLVSSGGIKERIRDRIINEAIPL